MSSPSERDAQVYADTLRLLLTGGCLSYLFTGLVTLWVGHSMDLLTTPWPVTLVSFLLWWMVFPVLPAVVLHPLAVRRVRVTQARREIA